MTITPTYTKNRTVPNQDCIKPGEAQNRTVPPLNPGRFTADESGLR